MFAERKALYKRLERDRDSVVIAYVTGDRRGLETQISPEAVDLFVRHLDRIGVVPRLSLVLHTPGGHTLAAWSLINLLRVFAEEVEIIVPRKAQSAGTLMCLGADSIMMTKQAVLGPIDPSVTTPLNPQIPGAGVNARMPVSVENINGYIEFARSALGENADLTTVFEQLSKDVHPLVLGGAFRARSQIRMLAGRLLKQNKRHTEAEAEKLLKFLCSDSGSHDYTINRREAKAELNLPVTKPDAKQYQLIKKLFDDYSAELALDNPYDPKVILGGQPSATYAFPRALIESVLGGSHSFCSEGNVTLVTVAPGPPPQMGIKDERSFEGWRHVSA